MHHEAGSVRMIDARILTPLFARTEEPMGRTHSNSGFLRGCRVMLRGLVRDAHV